MCIRDRILAALKSGEENAFKEFFMEYHDILVLFATHILKNVDAAEDVVQECFMNIWENSLFNRLSNGLDKYMFQLVKNAALNDLRGSKRRDCLLYTSLHERHDAGKSQRDRILQLRNQRGR